MRQPQMQMTVGGLLLVVACVALNCWLFRLDFLAGLVGLSVTKHLVIAYLCKVLGVDRRAPEPSTPPAPPRLPSLAGTVPPA